MDRAQPKRLSRFRPSFRRNLVVLVALVTGIILLAANEVHQHGLTILAGLAAAFLIGLAAATAMNIHHEHQSWAMLGELRKSTFNIDPAGAGIEEPPPLSSGSQALEAEIHALSTRLNRSPERDQHLRDLETLQEQELANMAELASGVAHEIRNPLAGIGGAVEILARSLPNDHPDREIIADVRQEVRGIVKVLNDMQAFSRPKPPKPGIVDLRVAVDRAVEFAREQAGSKNVEYSVQIPSPAPHFHMDPDQFHEVLSNLLVNSIQAIEENGKVTVEAQVLPTAGAPGQSLYQAHDLEISVSDTGSGISKGHLEKIFRPFYSTKQDGAGLGLAVCRRIIRRQGGTISAASEVNKGSRFVFCFPMREAKEPIEGLNSKDC